jgi:hypothetical protein
MNNVLSLQRISGGQAALFPDDWSTISWKCYTQGTGYSALSWKC